MQLADLLVAVFVLPSLSSCAEDSSRNEPTVANRSMVIGGSPTAGEARRATGALIRNVAAGDAGPAIQLICTGTLIGPRTVLTAAHCLTFLGAAVPDFVLVQDVAQPRHGSIYRGRSGHVHPRFMVSTAEGRAHDIAILELSEPVNATAPAALPSEPIAAPYLVAGGVVELVGYGAPDGDSTKDGIRNAAQAEIATVSHEEFVVGSSDSVRNCTGDSGGPALVRDGESLEWVLGVASRSAVDDAPCSSGGVHVRVDSHLEWIDEVTNSIGRPHGGCSIAASKPRPSMWLLAGVVATFGLKRARVAKAGTQPLLEPKREAASTIES